MVSAGCGGDCCRTARATLAVQAAATRHARRVLPIIIELRCTGIFSLGKIARELRRRGVRTARGGQWHPMTVGRLLSRRRLAGCLMTLPEMSAVHQANVVSHARHIKSLVQGLMARRFDNTAKLSAELNRNDELTITGRQWSPNSLGMYLKQHSPRIYDRVECGGRLRIRQIGAAIDRLNRRGVVALAAIAEALNKEGVPTLSGKAMWTARIVGEFFQKSPQNRNKKIELKNKTAAVIDRPKQQAIVTPPAIAEELNKEGIPTLSRAATLTGASVHCFRKQGQTRTPAAIKARTEQIEAALECLRKRGLVTPVAIAAALNDNNVPTPSGRVKWSNKSLHRFLKKLGQTKTVASIEAHKRQIEAEIECLQRKGIITLTAIAKTLNENEIPTLSSAKWTKSSVHRFLSKLGKTKSASLFKIKSEQIRPILNEIVRRYGRMDAARIAVKLNEKCAPTISGSATRWTSRMVRTLYQRLGRPSKPPRFWNKTRVARVVELQQAGESPAAIADEFIEDGITEHAVRRVLWRAKDPAYPKRR